MNAIRPAIYVYLIVCVIAILVPASEGYGNIAWKLFVGQIFALPAFFIAALISIRIKRREGNHLR